MSILPLVSLHSPKQPLNDEQISYLWENVDQIPARMQALSDLIRFCEKNGIDYEIGKDAELQSNDPRVFEYTKGIPHGHESL